MKLSRQTSIVTKFDNAILKVTRSKCRHEKRYAAIRPTAKNIDHVLNDMDIIDSKSSALLTHVSIMLAVVAILMAISTSVVWKSILAVELVAFTLVGLALLRCVDIMGPPYRRASRNIEALSEIYHREILVRRAIYQSMVRSVFILSLLLVVIVLFKAVIDVVLLQAG
ncbi:MAG: hypothetical protein AAF663_10555 [Planctomycetota bacterium]